MSHAFPFLELNIFIQNISDTGWRHTRAPSSSTGTPCHPPPQEPPDQPSGQPAGFEGLLLTKPPLNEGFADKHPNLASQFEV